MIFQNPSHSAQLLSQKIKDENLTSVIPVSINPDAYHYCQMVCQNLGLTLTPLETIINQKQNIDSQHILLLDDGSTRVGEYPQFVDYLRQHFTTSNIIIAVPFIPKSEEDQFRGLSDSLLTLHIEPLFFSPSQFYQNS